MYESQASEYKYEIERLARELQEIKKKYFHMKKNEQRQKFADIDIILTILSKNVNLSNTLLCFDFELMWF